MKEVWKPVKGYEGIYEISNLGKVKSLSRIKKCGWKDSKPQITKEKILKQHIDNLGYERVKLLDGSKTVHKLLAETFLPNPDNYNEINHKDGDKLNNSLDNLQWCTRSENIKHAFEIGLKTPKKGEENNKSKLKENDVREIRKLFSTGNYSKSELGRMFGVTASAVYYIIKNKTWKDVV